MKPSTRFAVLARDNFTCQYCGAAGIGAELEVDHINPRAHGGKDNKENLITACFDCNRGKGTQIVKAPSERKLTSLQRNPLVGRFFHSIKLCDICQRERIHWQGYILGELPNNWYLVQLFSWVVGEPTTQHLVQFQDMSLWWFYDNSEDMNFQYEERYTQHDDCHKE